jgi:MFS family permease
MSNVNEDSLRYQGWRAVAGSGVGVFFGSAFVLTFAVLLKPLSEEFSWSREAVSSAFAAMTVSIAVSSPVVGLLADRFGPRPIAGPSLMLAACAFASLSALTASLWHLYAVYVLIGLASAGTSIVVYSRIISGWFDRRRGVAFAAMISSIAVGGIVNPPALQALVAAVGWRRACLVSGAIIAAIGVPIVAFCVRQAHGHDVQAGQDVPGRSISDALRSRAYWTLLVVVFGMTLALNGVIVHLSALLIDRGLPVAYAVTVMSALGAGSLAGRLITGWLLDKFAAIPVSFVLLALAATGVYLLAGADSFTAGVIAAACIGFGTGGEVDVVPYLLSRYFGLRSLGTLTGVVWMAFGVAGAVGPVLMGRAFDATGSYEHVLIAMAVGVLAAAALMLTLPSYQPRSVGVASVA